MTIDAPPPLQFRLDVDAAHCERAAQGLRAMAQYQYRGLVRRYEFTGRLLRFQQFCRKWARKAAAVAIVAGGVSLVAAQVNESARHIFWWLAAILFAEAAVLWLLPRDGEPMGKRLRLRFEKSFGDKAAALMLKTREAAPFEAVYDLRGDLLTYSRVVDGQSTQRWLRHFGKLPRRAIVLQTPGLLAVFRKPAAVTPTMILLTAEDDALAAAIRALGWTIVALDPATGEPLASPMRE